MLVVGLGGPTMFARIGVMRALNQGIVADRSTRRFDTSAMGNKSRGYFYEAFASVKRYGGCGAYPPCNSLASCAADSSSCNR